MLLGYMSNVEAHLAQFIDQCCLASSTRTNNTDTNIHISLIKSHLAEGELAFVELGLLEKVVP